MPDKVDIEKITRAAETGQGCTVLDVLSTLSLTEQFRALKQMKSTNQEHRKQNNNTPELEFVGPHIDGVTVDFSHIKIWRVNPGLTINDAIFEASGYFENNKVEFECTNLNSDGHQTRKVTKPMY